MPNAMQVFSGKMFGMPRWLVLGGGGLAAGLALIMLRGGGQQKGAAFDIEDRARLDNILITLQNLMGQIQYGDPSNGGVTHIPPPEVETNRDKFRRCVLNTPAGQTIKECLAAPNLPLNQGGMPPSGQGIPVPILGGIIGGGLPVIWDMWRNFREGKRGVGQGVPVDTMFEKPRCIDSGVATLTIGFDNKWNSESLP